MHREHRPIHLIFSYPLTDLTGSVVNDTTKTIFLWQKKLFSFMLLIFFMVDDFFKIYVEQLRDGHQEKIEECFSPEFLDIHEAELSFKEDVAVKGVAYLADDNLVLHLEVFTRAVIPCAVCNEEALVDLRLPSFYHVEPLDQIRSGVFNFAEPLRVAILLEVPYRAECHGGSCPERKTMEKYFKKSDKPSKEEETYRPFADLDMDDQTKS